MISVVTVNNHDRHVRTRIRIVPITFIRNYTYENAYFVQFIIKFLDIEIDYTYFVYE